MWPLVMYYITVKLYLFRDLLTMKPCSFLCDMICYTVNNDYTWYNTSSA